MYYDYVCNNCGNEMIDVEQSIKDKAYRKCPECNHHSLNRVIHGGYFIAPREATTIGQVMDRNAKKNKKRYDDTPPKPEKEKTWYDKHRTATTKEIKKMTKDQQKRYIMEGK